MAWGKVDDRLHSTRKWRRTSKGGRALWTTALSWCMSELTDGHVPADMLPVLDGNRADAASLVASGLWHTEQDGWYFHDWLDYQPSKERITEERAAAAERQRVAREKARDKRRDAEPVTGEVTRESQVQSRSPRPDPTRPDPTSLKEGSPLGGNSPKQAAEFAPQACGRSHDPAKSCGACATARREVKSSDAAVERETNRRQRADDERARKAREAEAAATEPASRELVQAAIAKVRAARTTKENKS